MHVLWQNARRRDSCDPFSRAHLEIYIRIGRASPLSAFAVGAAARMVSYAVVCLDLLGKLVALHNGDGQLVWSRSFDELSRPTRLLPWRGFHDIQHSTEVLLLREAQPGAYAAVLNAHTGEQLWYSPLEFGVAKVVPLHAPMHEGTAFQSVYLLLEQATRDTSDGIQPQFRLLPDSAASRNHVAASERSLHFIMQGQSANNITGFRLAPTADATGPLLAVQTWQVNLPDSVLAIAYRDPTEPIQSSVKVGEWGNTFSPSICWAGHS